MSNAIVPFNDYAIVKSGIEDVMEVVRQNLGDSASISRFDLERIKIPGAGGKAWDLTDENMKPAPAVTFDAIILHQKTVRSYWEKAYGDGEVGPPNCSSEDGNYGAGEPGGICSKCSLNQYGTAAKGRGKACREMKALFLLRPGFVMPTLICLPPSSLTNHKDYVMALINRRRFVYSVVSSFGLEQDKGGESSNIDYSKVTLHVGSMLDPDQIKLVNAVRLAFTPMFEAIKASDVVDTEHTEKASADADMEDDMAGIEDAAPLEEDFKDTGKKSKKR
jgi:hypothetical protein